MLIILDGDGQVITSSGRAVVSGDKEGKVYIEEKDLNL